MPARQVKKSNTGRSDPAHPPGSRQLVQPMHPTCEFWDSLSGGRALQSGIFLVWTKHSGYAKSFLIRSIRSGMRTVSPGTLIEAGRSFIVCSGQ